MAQAIAGYVPDELKPILEEKRSVDFSLTYNDKDADKSTRFRVNAAHDINGRYLAFRIIPSEIREIDSIGFPSDIWKSIIEMEQGLVLVTGGTGSGKTTTLASLIQEINRNYAKHIVTIENPVEYLHPPIKSIISQRELNHDVLSFADGVHDALRQDPDVILIGEIRDYETAVRALEAASTGHLVFSTLHTNSAVDAVRRNVSMFTIEEQNQARDALASNLSFVLSQQLIPPKKGKGRTLAMEVLNVRDNSGVKNHLRKGEYNQLESDLQLGRNTGMISMDARLLELNRSGVLSKDEAVRYARSPVYVQTEIDRK